MTTELAVLAVIGWIMAGVGWLRAWSWKKRSQRWRQLGEEAGDTLEQLTRSTANLLYPHLQPGDKLKLRSILKQ